MRDLQPLGGTGTIPPFKRALLQISVLCCGVVTDFLPRESVHLGSSTRYDMGCKDPKDKANMFRLDKKGEKTMTLQQARIRVSPVQV